MEFRQPPHPSTSKTENLRFCTPSTSKTKNAHQQNRKPQILLAATGCITAESFHFLCYEIAKWADVTAIATNTALKFIHRTALPDNVVLYTDEHEWTYWNTNRKYLLADELQRWADVLVIAPLSANTLAKIAGRLCDNLLTSIVRKWDYKNKKPMYVAPSMNHLMWENSLTQRQLKVLEEDFGVNIISFPPPSAAGTVEMFDPRSICSYVRYKYELSFVLGVADRNLDAEKRSNVASTTRPASSSHQRMKSV